MNDVPLIFVLVAGLFAGGALAASAAKADSRFKIRITQDKFTIDAVAALPEEKISDGMDAAAKAGLLRVKVTLTNDTDFDVETKGLRAVWTGVNGVSASPATLIEIFQKLNAHKAPDAKPPLLLADVTNHQLSLMRVDSGDRIYGYLLFDAGSASPAGGTLRLVGLRNTKGELAPFKLVFTK